MVASSQPLASMVGVDILKRGGNACDAAIAVAAALTVTEPCSTGLGGDCFLLHYDAKTKKVEALNGSGRCAKAMTLEFAQNLAKEKNSGNELPVHHGACVTVPGAAAGWCDAIDKWGSTKLTLSEILEPAAQLAEDDNAPIAPVTAYSWDKGRPRLLSSVNAAELLIKDIDDDGNEILRAPNAGEAVPRPGLAKVLRLIGSKGKDGFYKGEVAEAIVTEVEAHGGLLSLDDLAEHSSTFPEPISAAYRGVRLHEVPPNGQGIAALIALNVLSELEEKYPDLHSNDLERQHAMIESMRYAFADTRGYVGWDTSKMGTGDGGGEEVKISETASSSSSSGAAASTTKNGVVTSLLSKEYAVERSKVFNPDTACVGADRGSPDKASCTVSFQVVDREGNAVSMVNSNYMGFGTGFIPKGCSFTLQNRGHNFSLDPSHPNAVEPGKRPFHTIIPAMSTWDSTGDLHATYSNMGGFMQPQGHMQLLVNMVTLGMNPQSAIDAPRFCIEDGTSGGVLTIEDGTKPEIFEGLCAKGHTPMRMTRGTGRFVFGRAQIISKDVKTGALWGGSDGRADGCAIGY